MKIVSICDFGYSMLQSMAFKLHPLAQEFSNVIFPQLFYDVR